MKTTSISRASKAPSRILDAVHETATDLRNVAFIDACRMRHYDALCLDAIPAYSGEGIRALRDPHKLSHAVLASVLNTSLSTVRQREIGDKHPSEPSLKLLSLLDKKGLEVLISPSRRDVQHASRPTAFA
jgi:putative transcriptional regulator